MGKMQVRRMTQILMLMVIISGTLVAQSGTALLKLGEQPPENLDILSATLYKDVLLRYDTNVRVRTAGQEQHFYYPQVLQGNDVVLSLILGTAGDDDNPNPTRLYDVYYVLGAAFVDSLILSNRDSAAFIFPRSSAIHRPAYGRSLNGTFRIKTESGLNPGTTGTFRSTFEFPTLADPQSMQQVSLSGDMKIPLENVRQGESVSTTPVDQRKQRLKRNIYIAVITSLFLVAMVVR